MKDFINMTILTLGLEILKVGWITPNYIQTLWRNLTSSVDPSGLHRPQFWQIGIKESFCQNSCFLHIYRLVGELDLSIKSLAIPFFLQPMIVPPWWPRDPRVLLPVVFLLNSSYLEVWRSQQKFHLLKHWDTVSSESFRSFSFFSEAVTDVFCMLRWFSRWRGFYFYSIALAS